MQQKTNDHYALVRQLHELVALLGSDEQRELANVAHTLLDLLAEQLQQLD